MNVVEDGTGVSFAFSNQDVEPAAEVVVKVININYGHNDHLMQGADDIIVSS